MYGTLSLSTRAILYRERPMGSVQTNHLLASSSFRPTVLILLRLLRPITNCGFGHIYCSGYLANRVSLSPKVLSNRLRVNEVLRESDALPQILE